MTVADEPSANASGRQFARNAAWSYLNLVIGVVLSLLLTRVILKHLGAGTYGLWIVLLSITTYLALLDSGVSTAVVQRVAWLSAIGDRDETADTIRTALVFFFITGAVAVLVTVALAPFVASFLHLGDVSGSVAGRTLVILGVMMAVKFVGSVPSAILFGAGRGDRQSQIGGLGLILTELCQVLVVLAGGGLVGLALVTLGGTLFSFGFTSGIVRRTTGSTVYNGRFRRDLLIDLLRFGGRNTAIAVGGIISYSLDALVIGLILPVAKVAPYDVALSTANLTRGLTTQGTDMLLPTYAHFESREDAQRQGWLFSKAVMVSLAISVPMLIAARRVRTAHPQALARHGSPTDVLEIHDRPRHRDRAAAAGSPVLRVPDGDRRNQIGYPGCHCSVRSSTSPAVSSPPTSSVLSGPLSDRSPWCWCSTSSSCRSWCAASSDFPSAGTGRQALAPVVLGACRGRTARRPLPRLPPTARRIHDPGRRGGRRPGGHRRAGRGSPRSSPCSTRCGAGVPRPVGVPAATIPAVNPTQRRTDPVVGAPATGSVVSVATDLAPSGDPAEQDGTACELPGSELRVVLWMPQARRVAGGHVVQFEETAKALRHHGVIATPCFATEPDLAGVDLVHGFDLPPEAVHRCHDLGLPVAVSPVYWETHWGPEGLSGLTPRAFLGRVRRAARFRGAAMTSESQLARMSMASTRLARSKLALFESVDLLLPNSEGEAETIRHDLGVSTPMIVVPNAVNPDRFDQPGLPFRERDTVLYVGRIDPHKNQLGLIHALRGSGRRLVLVGYDHPDHPDYVAACRKAGRGWVEFAGGHPPDELPAYFAAARVHVVPSWYETTGLVSLEAALSGCAVVSTDRGHARAYLGDRAIYCDPAVKGSIRSAVDAAWDRDPGQELRRHVLDHFTWDHTAAATVAAYRSVLARRRGYEGSEVR